MSFSSDEVCWLLFLLCLMFLPVSLCQTYVGIYLTAILYPSSSSGQLSHLPIPAGVWLRAQCVRLRSRVTHRQFEHQRGAHSAGCAHLHHTEGFVKALSILFTLSVTNIFLLTLFQAFSTRKQS